MAKNPTNRNMVSASAPKSTKHASKPKAFPRTQVIVVALVALGLAWGAFLWWRGREVVSSFDSLVTFGKAQLSRVIERPDTGRGHGTDGQPLGFSDDPPTSGIHWPSWINAGFYTTAEPKEKLVHALEHGNVVIYYDQPGAEALGTLRAWAGQFRGQWDGIVVVPKAGLGPIIELTAWNKLLRLDGWDAPTVAAFVDAYRGRGPENPVR